MSKSPLPPADVSKVTRLEVIDQNGRRYVNTDVSDVEFSFQDDGRTLKVFIRNAGVRHAERDPRVLQQDELTVEEIAKLRQSSQDAISYFQAKLAKDRTPKVELQRPRELTEQEREDYRRSNDEARTEPGADDER